MSKIRTDQLSITASAQQIVSSGLETSHYRLKAPSSNTGFVYLGRSGVTTATGYALEPGEELVYSFSIEPGEPDFDVPITDWYAVGTNGDKITWLAHLRAG